MSYPTVQPFEPRGLLPATTFVPQLLQHQPVHYFQGPQFGAHYSQSPMAFQPPVLSHGSSQGFYGQGIFYLSVG